MIAIVDENPVRAAILQECVREAGRFNVARTAERTNSLSGAISPRRERRGGDDCEVRSR